MRKVGDIMSKSLVTVSKDTTLDVVHRTMQEKNIHHILVTGGDGKLLGIISDRDVKKFISPFVGSDRETPQDTATLHIKVERVMKTNVITVTPDDSVKFCIQKLLEKNIHALPVVEKDTSLLKGIVTTTNILKWMATEL